MYNTELEEAKAEFEKVRKEHVKAQLKKRLEKKELLERELGIVNKEIENFVSTGSTHNIDDYFKIDSSESGFIECSNNAIEPKNVCLQINKDTKV